MPGTGGGPAQLEVAPSFEHAVEDGLSEIRIMEDPAPGTERLVGREQRGAVMQVALIDDVEEEVGGIGPIAEIPDLIDDEDVGMRVRRQGMAEAALARRDGELVDEGRRRGEARLESVLDGAIGDGDGEVCLAGAGWAAGDEAEALRDQFGAEEAAERRQAEAGLKGEVELADLPEFPEKDLPEFPELTPSGQAELKLAAATAATT